MKIYQYLFILISLHFVHGYTCDEQRAVIVQVLNQKFNSGPYHLNSKIQTLLQAASDEHVQTLQKVKFVSVREKETFIYFLNKTSLSGKKSLSEVTEKSYKMLHLYKLQQTNFQKLKKFFFSKPEQGSLGIESFFSQALQEDKDVRDKVAYCAEQMNYELSMQKEDVLNKLEEEVNKAILQEIERSGNQVKQALEQEIFEDEREVINLQHNARLYYLIKSCKDMVFALRPMCSGSQELCMIVDRQTYAPIINILDPLVLPEDPFDKNIVYADLESVELENNLKLLQKKMLKKGYVIKIPQHKLSQVSFLEKLRSIYWKHHIEPDNLNASSSSFGSDWCVIDMSEVEELPDEPIGYSQWAYNCAIGLVTATASRLSWWSTE